MSTGVSPRYAPSKKTLAPSGSLLDDLGAGDLDVVVCVAPAEPVRGVTTESLLDEDLAIYRPDGRRAGPAEHWGPWVTFPGGSQTRELIGRELRRRGATFDVVAESHQPEVLREMVSLGLGWTVLPAVQAEREPGALEPFEPTALTSRTLVAAWRDSAVTPAGALALRDALRPLA